MSDSGSAYPARFATGVTWALLLLGFWLWGVDLTDGSRHAAPATGDVAAAGRPVRHALPAPHAPLRAVAIPRRVDIDAIGVRARVQARGLDRGGAVDPPPFGVPGVAAWYRQGPRPGAPGAALLVGHLDTRTKRAVFHRLGSVQPGELVRISRSDHSTAQFTVESVEVFTEDRFDARRVYGARQPGRAELRLITCGGSYDRARHAYSANVVVSAYLTGATPGRRRAEEGSYRLRAEAGS
ncbi:class F sortase [Streptomyces sp. H27-D2]|uniref:class F sortase n=1 Tax=Streptomyces sp. H27-D2 TaxID=3046304 RepID=UPI002DBCEA1C|nr:class F sortase [Streptomyces sp. H27-D2]MEC4015180.1 class F sortase [Streptomyces sp. H27-D2]